MMITMMKKSIVLAPAFHYYFLTALGQIRIRKMEDIGKGLCPMVE